MAKTPAYQVPFDRSGALMHWADSRKGASWLIKNPQQAGQDVSHLFAWFSYAVGQLGKFIGAI